MKAPPKPKVVDVEYAKMYAAWILWVRRAFPDAFQVIDEGCRVRWEGDEVTAPPGVVISVVYNPQRKSYYIVVVRGGQHYCFTNPNDLIKVGFSRALN